MTKLKLVTQMQQTECGLCALQMILNYYNVNVTLNDLNRLVEVGRDGLSIKSMKNVFNHFNMNSETVKIELKKSPELKKILPFVMLHKNGHYVVIGELKLHGAVVYDPAVGKRFLSFADIKQDYYPYAITAVPGEGFTKIERKKSENIITKCIWKHKKEFIRMLLISMLVYICMFIIPLLSKQLIDTIMSDALSQQLIKKWVIVICIAFFSYYLILYMKSIISVKISMTLDRFLSSTVIDKLFRNNLKFF